MSLDTIVNVSITTQATAPEQANFGTPLVVGYHTNFAERTRVYSAATGLADMVTDGFLTTDPIYQAASKILSQNPKVTEFLVGRMAESPIRTIKFTPVLAELEAGVAVPFVINGQAVTATAATPTVAEFTASMKANIDALALTGVTTTDNGTDLDITGSTGVEVTAEMPRRQIKRKDNTPNTGSGIVADLIAIQDENDSWYSIVLAQESEAITNAAAAHVETLRKSYQAVSGDDDILDSGSSTDLASDLSAANYARTALHFHPKPHLYPNAAAVGVELPKDPGSYTMKFKTLNGVEVTNLSTSEKTNAAAKRANTYTEVAGIAIVEEGVTSAAGEFIDVVRGVDWLQARLQERIFTLFINNDKVPFTDIGVGLIEAEIAAQLQDAITAGLLAADPAPVVTVPRVADVPFADRAARCLTGLTFNATLAGAIHKVEIQGTVTA